MDVTDAITATMPGVYSCGGNAAPHDCCQHNDIIRDVRALFSLKHGVGAGAVVLELDQDRYTAVMEDNDSDPYGKTRAPLPPIYPDITDLPIYWNITTKGLL